MVANDEPRRCRGPCGRLLPASAFHRTGKRNRNGGRRYECGQCFKLWRIARRRELRQQRDRELREAFEAFRRREIGLDDLQAVVRRLLP